MTKHVEPVIPRQESGKSLTTLYHSSMRASVLSQLSYITISSHVDGKIRTLCVSLVYENPVT